MGSIDISQIKDEKLRNTILKQWATEDHNRRAAQSAKLESSFENDSLATDAREGDDTVRRFARVKIRCFRLRPLDDENPCTKFFTDALRYAGAIFDDSKEWAKIEVEEIILNWPQIEWTEIEIDYSPDAS